MEGRKEGMTEGMMEGRKEGRKERASSRREEWKEGRGKGGREGRRKGEIQVSLPWATRPWLARVAAGVPRPVAQYPVLAGVLPGLDSLKAMPPPGVTACQPNCGWEVTIASEDGIVGRGSLAYGLRCNHGTPS